MHTFMTVLRMLGVLLSTIPFSILSLTSIVIDKSGRMYTWVGTTWSKICLWVCGVTVSVRGMENIDPKGNYIFVSNHASMFDIVAILSIVPHIRFMFKKELGYIPLWGWCIRYGHHIMVDRKKGTEAMKSLHRAMKEVQSGGAVLLFAEGTRTRDGKLQPFKRGAFALASKSGVPIVPLTINGSYKIMPKASLSIRPNPVELVFEKPISTAHITTREHELAMMEQVHSIIEKNYKEDI